MKPTESPLTLTQWLRIQFPGCSHNDIKQWLRLGQVTVNGKTTSNGGMILQSDDRVERHKQNSLSTKLSASPLPIIYIDQAIVVIDKPTKLLTIATEQEHQQTAYRLLSNMLSQETKQKPIFIVHRLDRETSGLLVFARNPSAKQLIQEEFQTRHAVRRYIAIIEGEPPAEQGMLKHFLAENSQHKVYVAQRPSEGKEAILHYLIRRRLGHYTELEIMLETGRHGQIRTQLSAIGHPIVGDLAAGSRHNPIKRLALHAHYLAIHHPVTGKLQEFHSQLPSIFQRFK
ncbi:MAG: RluA family pseudouridine synthase [Acidobacteria bacterium]|nr:RluA family pseudouridine synthase [Acidobacteriota bacterium]